MASTTKRTRQTGHSFDETKFLFLVRRALTLIDGGMAPHQAWDRTLEAVYPPKMLTNQKKHSCPKWALSVLCELGNVRGVQAGCCPEARDRSSAAFTVQARDALHRSPALVDDPAALKRRVFGKKGDASYRKPNDEVEVLLAIKALNRLQSQALDGAR